MSDQLHDPADWPPWKKTSWVGPRASLDTTGKWKISCNC